MTSLEAKQTYSGRRPAAGLANAGCPQTVAQPDRISLHVLIEKAIWASLRHWSFANLQGRHYGNPVPAWALVRAGLKKIISLSGLYLSGENSEASIFCGSASTK